MQRLTSLLLAAIFACLPLAAQTQPTTTSLAASPANTATFGAAVTLTATVSPASSGKVTFYDGASVIGTSSLSAGTATLTTKFLPTGTNRLTARYIGNGSSAASVSAAKIETIVSLPQNGFAGGVIYPTGVGPWGVATADFNNDGKADVVVANYTSISPPSVSVFLGTGTGTLGTATNYTVAANPIAVAVGDFNGDGYADIAVASYSPSGVISILLGNGSGGFAAAVSYTDGVGTQPEAIAVGDFNGDGYADLAIANNGSANISILLGTGTGTFGTGTTYSVGPFPGGIVTGDFNGDGVADLAVANFGNANNASSISVLLGAGGGLFASSVNYQTGGTGTYSVALGDFNGDGILDLATPNYSSNNVSVLLGTGTGTFGTAAQFAVGTSPTYIAVGDFNGDGKPDIATTNDVNDNVNILPGNGSGGFAAAISNGDGGGASVGRGLAVADFNGDGLSDLVVSNYSGSTESILLGVAKAPVSLTLSSGGNPSQLGTQISLTATVTPSTTAGRVTFYDGLIPIGDAAISSGTAILHHVILPAGTNSLTALFPGDSTNSPAKATAISQVVTALSSAGLANTSYIAVGTGPRLMFYGDFNLDGKADIVTSNTGSNTISIALGNGGGTLLPRTDYTLPASPLGLVVVDLNNDGIPDLALTTAASTIVTLIGNGDGTFQTATSFAAVNTPYLLATADIDGDGNADLIVPSVSNGTVNVFFGQGDGTFRSPAASYSLGAGSGPYAVAAGDFNGDGYPDVAVLLVGPSQVAILLGSADGTLNQAALLSTDADPFEIVTGDFNGDGKQDLAIGLSVSSAPLTGDVFLGNGDGTFGSKLQTNLGNYPFQIATGDINGDGKADLVAADLEDGNLNVAYGNGDGTFQNPVAYPVSASVAAVAVADFNRDGRSDVVVGSNDVATVTVFLGQSTVGPAGIAVTSSANPSTAGQSVTFTATLTPSTATGTVVFKDNGTTIATQTISGGIATYTTSTLAPGSHPITGVYSGDANNGANTSSVLTQTVNHVSTTTSLATSLSPSTYGAAVTLTATVSPATATGTVTFIDGGTAIGTGTLNASGVATLSISTLAAGSHSLIAAYGGDTNDAGSASSIVTQVVTSPSIIVVPAGLAPGTAYRLIFITDSTIYNASSSVIGDYNSAVTADADSVSALNQLGISWYVVGGTATVSPLANMGGVADAGIPIYGLDGTLIASGDQTFFTNQGSVPVDISPTNLKITGVQWWYGGAEDGSLNAANALGTSSPELGNNGFGADSRTFGYTTSANTSHNYLLGISGVLVVPAATYMSLSTSMTPSSVGQQITLTAMVSPSDATGTVTFQDGGTTIGTGTLVNGSATLNISTLAPGSHSLTASYGGDINYQGSASTTLTQIVNGITTTTALISSLNPSAAGAAVTLMAAVSPTGATGTVTFEDGGSSIGTGTLNANGVATLAISTLAAGSHSLTALYGGDATHGTSVSNTVTQVVNTAASSIILTSSANPSAVGQGVAFTAIVAPSTATGTVTFFDGTTALGSPVTLSSGTAGFVTNSLAAGSHTLTASYSGDSNFSGSTSHLITTPLNFSAAAAGTLADSTGQGTGFTTRLPGTGGSLAAHDANLTLNTATGRLTVKSTAADLNGQSNLGLAEYLGIPAAVNAGNQDFVVSATFRSFQYSQNADQVGIFVGSATTSNFRAGGLFLGVREGFTVQTPGIGDQNLQTTTAIAPNQGDDVIFTLARTSGTWSFAIQDLTTPSLSGSVAVVQPTYLNGLSTLVAGVFAANPGNTTSKTETISAFSLAVGAQIVGSVATSTTTLTSSLNPSTFGAPVVLTATVSPSTATGTVTFSDGSTTPPTPLGTGTLSNGTATLSTTGLSVASHSLTASYAGDANDAASVSSILTQTVNQASTTVTLTSSQNPATSGTAITLTATVSPSTATGTVTFKDSGSTIGTGTLSSGVARLSASLSYGTHTLTAAYSGDGNDPSGVSANLLQSITYPSLVITTQSLPAGQVGAPYGPVTMQATGGSGSYTWSAGGLPAGISMGASGTLGGSAAAAFSGTVNVTVSDNVSHLSASSSYSLTLVSSTLTISGAANLGAVAVGGTLSGSFTASGGIPPYTWSLAGAPGGFSVSANGAISGIGSSPGNSGFSVVAKDSTPGNPLTASLGLTYSVFGITTGSLPSASTLSNYSASITAVGGTPPYAFTASGIPAGLSFSGGAIGGRPTTPGNYSIAVNASDSKGLTASASLGLQVTGSGPLQVLSSSLAAGAVTQPYSQTLNAEGGSPAYTWSQSGGTIPPGLSLTSGGTVFGQPTLSGSYAFGVQVNDTSGGQAVGSVSITIQPAPLQITNGAPLPAGIAGTAYPGQVLSATGGVAPYTFSIQGSLPAGLTLSNGQLSGTPTVAGSSSFTLMAADSASPPATATLGMSVTIRPNSADLVLSAGTASFALASGTSAVPSPSSITVSSSSPSQLLNFSVNASSAPWVSVSGGTSTPGNLSIGLTSAALALSTSGSPYSGNVIITCTSGPCSGNSQTIGVSLSVTSPPPQLSLSASIFSFDALSTSPQPSAAVLGIQNSGGGTLNLTSVTSGASWISIGGFPSTVAPGPGAAVNITANPSGLGAGFYTSTISVSSSAGNATIPVNLLISAKPSMVLGPGGAQFSMPQGGALGNSAGSFLVSVSSTAAVTYTATVQPGASWLTGGSSGNASGASPGVVNYSLNAAAVAALPVGAYYGTIQVSGTGIVNTPQSFQVVLNIAPANTPVVPDPEPGGLLFLSSSSGPLAPQAIQVFASSVTPLPYQASATVNNGSGWLSISSTSGSAVAGSPGQILVSVNSTGLAAGVYTGGINFASGPSVRTVNVTLVAETPLSAGASLQAASESSLKPETTSPVCANAKLVPASTGLGSNFAAPASWPTPITVTLVDTCGSIIGKGQIVATFSTGDPPLELSPLNTTAGTYSGTWTPHKSSSQITINAQATATGYSAATIQIGGQVTPNAAPQLTPNGTLDVFNPEVGSGLGPGNIVQIYGTALASQPVSATTLPLPTKVSGTQVLIGGITAPLFYVSPNQINAQIPFELTAGQQYQVIVNANGALTTPQPIQLNAGTPAVLQFTSGLVVAQHPDGTLVSTTSPASPGEYIVLYMTGLGATDITVPSGQASPSNPPANVLDVPTVTLNGNAVNLLFAGLTPGLVGLYQINIQVPVGLVAGTYDLAISQDGVASNTTSLPVLAPTSK